MGETEDVHESIGSTWAINAAITRHVKNVSINLTTTTTTTQSSLSFVFLALKNNPTHREINRLFSIRPIKRCQQSLREQPLLTRSQPPLSRPDDPRTDQRSSVSLIRTTPHPFPSDEFASEQHDQRQVKEKLEQAQQPNLTFRRRVRFGGGWIWIASSDGG
jgi:hypothetical protein